MTSIQSIRDYSLGVHSIQDKVRIVLQGSSKNHDFEMLGHHIKEGLGVRSKQELATPISPLLEVDQGLIQIDHQCILSIYFHWGKDLSLNMNLGSIRLEEEEGHIFIIIPLLKRLLKVREYLGHLLVTIVFFISQSSPNTQNIL